MLLNCSLFISLFGVCALNYMVLDWIIRLDEQTTSFIIFYSFCREEKSDIAFGLKTDIELTHIKSALI